MLQVRYHKTTGDGHCFYRALYNLLSRTSRCSTFNSEDITSEMTGVRFLRSYVGLMLLTSSEVRTVIAEELKWINAGYLIPQDHTAMKLLYDQHNGLMPNTDQSLHELSDIVGNTSCWASAFEFAIIDRWLVKTAGINLVNISMPKTKSACRQVLLDVLSRVDIVCKYVIMVSTNDEHYRWVSLVSKADKNTCFTSGISRHETFCVNRDTVNKLLQKGHGVEPCLVT